MALNQLTCSTGCGSVIADNGVLASFKMINTPKQTKVINALK